MTEHEAEYFNSRHGAFCLSRFSRAQGRYITCGKPHRDIRDALKAAARADKRDPTYLTFIDVAPNALTAGEAKGDH